MKENPSFPEDTIELIFEYDAKRTCATPLLQDDYHVHIMNLFAGIQ
jgi:hypothetical protein